MLEPVASYNARSVSSALVERCHLKPFMHGRYFLLLLADLGLRFFLYPLGTADFADEKPLVPPLNIVKFFATTFRTVAH